MHVAVRALASWTLAAAVLAGCGSPPTRAPERPEDVRARIASLLPANVVDRPGWALDITAAFTALGIAPTNEHACAVLAVVEQESTYRADPAVPGLGRIARDEIDRRADRAGVPKLLVQAALGLRSPDGRTWAERIDAARTEKELSDEKEALLKEFDNNLKQNGYLIGQLKLKYQYGEDPETLWNVPDYYRRLDAPAVQQAAKTYLTTGSFVQVVLMPEKK